RARARARPRLCLRLVPVPVPVSDSVSVPVPVPDSVSVSLSVPDPVTVSATVATVPVSRGSPSRFARISTRSSSLSLRRFRRESQARASIASRLAAGGDPCEALEQASAEKGERSGAPELSWVSRSEREKAKTERDRPGELAREASSPHRVLVRGEPCLASLSAREDEPENRRESRAEETER